MDQAVPAGPQIGPRVPELRWKKCNNLYNAMKIQRDENGCELNQEGD